jgi:hypothetical protein
METMDRNLPVHMLLDEMIMEYPDIMDIYINSLAVPGRIPITVDVDAEAILP